MTEIHLRAYAMKKNVIAELFLEIVNSGPFFNTAEKNVRKQINASVWGSYADVCQFCHDG